MMVISSLHGEGFAVLVSVSNGLADQIVPGVFVAALPPCQQSRPASQLPAGRTLCAAHGWPSC